MEQNYLESEQGRMARQIDSEQSEFDIIQASQIELINRYGGDNAAGEWIKLNAERFRTIVTDPKRNLIERLANEDMREGAFTEIQNTLNQ
jgi:hypothetical protein